MTSDLKSPKSLVESFNSVGDAEPLDAELVGRLRQAIVTLGHQKRQQEIHASVLKSQLLSLQAKLAEKSAIRVRVDEDTACNKCGRILNSTVCVVIDGRIHCSKCGR